MGKVRLTPLKGPKPRKSLTLNRLFQMAGSLAERVCVTSYLIFLCLENVLFLPKTSHIVVKKRHFFYLNVITKGLRCVDYLVFERRNGLTLLNEFCGL